MDNTTSQKADQLFFEADEKIHQGQFAEAKTLFEKSIELDPKHGRSYNHLGWIYETKYQDLGKAEEYYKKSMELSPEYTAGYSNYAIVLSKLERYDELTKHLEKAMKVPGINKETLYNEYGIMYERTGKLNEAIEAYTKAMHYTLSEQAVTSYKTAMNRCKAKMS